MPDAWVEILKVALPAVLGSAATGFYFNMRLKRVGSFEGTTKHLLDNMVQGGAAISAAADELLRTMKDIIISVEQDETSSFSDDEDLLSRAANLFAHELAAHRTYISEIVPYGHSESISGPIEAFDMYFSVYANGSTDRGKEETLRILRLEAKEFEDRRNSLRSQIERVHREILNGRMPRWYAPKSDFGIYR